MSESALAAEMGEGMAKKFLEREGQALPVNDVQFAGMLGIAFMLGREHAANARGIDLAALDKHLLFVQREAVYLESRAETWAQQKAGQWKQLAEFLRGIRQAQQMTGMNGRRIE